MRIALIAHDGKKAELVSFALQNKDLFDHHDLLATNTTGTVLEEAGFMSVQKMLSGPKGGDAQIASKLIQWLVSHDVPWRVLGAGSNVVIPDAGLEEEA